MRRALAAGVGYFAVVFAAGVLLGTVRTFAIAPHVGETVSVALELPFMLLASWLICGWMARRAGVPAMARARLAMGGIALALLLIAEALVSIQLGGLTLEAHLALYARAPALLGLAGQFGFAAFPLIRMARGPAAMKSARPVSVAAELAANPRSQGRRNGAAGASSIDRPGKEAHRHDE